ncbi:MAG: sulfatase-like hydrolase/transferase [Armatimonadota bacterium]|nr:sulfatase-like hydrolase/transferase [Armatimonadota bacterium]MDW8026375.1 sulfatase-like hydrolase/transferase [Armatimonadota bacterium]
MHSLARLQQICSEKAISFDVQIKRREFIGSFVGAVLAGNLIWRGENSMQLPERPNFLWITCEDMSSTLGCFGDLYAFTPNLDRLASEGVRFTNVFTHSPVCAPSRSGVITGMYPTSIGTHHMRCQAVPPPFVRCFTEYMRAAGYYCTNNAKTDYNFVHDPKISTASAEAAPLTAWDESSSKAHWRNRINPKQPFFAVFNITVTHESQLRSRDPNLLKRIEKLPIKARHDPAKAPVPPYLPDTPLVRRDIAQHYDTVTLMDMRAGEILRELEEDGLTENTIVWFWSDHGVGLPRGKRWVYDSGIRVPLIIRIPEKLRKWAYPDNPDRIKPGCVIDDLIAFVDFAPTMLSLAGIPVPKHMQGQAFLGPQKSAPRKFIYAARDRMDETYDIIRAVRDKRFKYIRNFAPHLPYAQEVEYAEETPTMQEWRRLNSEGKLNDVQGFFFLPTKPIEELYDTQTDPYETSNLADDPRYRSVLEAMRAELFRWMRESGDVGLIPEPELMEMMRPKGQWHKTAQPKLQILKQTENEVTIALDCATEGASIAYQIDANGKQGRWQLYTQPVKVRKGETLIAKACRLGCIDSDEVKWTFGEGESTHELKGSTEASLHQDLSVPNWRAEIDQSNVLERLLKLKMLDGQGEKALAAFLQALKDEHPAVRYWAVVGIYYTCKSETQRNQLAKTLKAMLNDPSPTVQIAAAHALCDWGWDESLSTLTNLLHHENEFVRLYAINALRSLGEKAKPALEAVKRALRDPSGYVRRVARTIMKRFG